MKLLFVLPRTPWPPYAGQARLAFNRAIEMKKLGHDVVLFAYGLSISLDDVNKNLQSSEPYSRFFVRSFNVFNFILNLIYSSWLWGLNDIPLISLAYTPKSIVTSFRELLRSQNFDVIHFYSINSFPLWSVASRSSTPYVVDLVDSMSLNLQKRIHKASIVFRWPLNMELRRIISFESHLPVYSCCSAFICVGQKDLDYLSYDKKSCLFPKPRFECHNIGVSIPDYRSPDLACQKPFRILFFGSLYYYPNIEAIHWFVDNVCPLLSKKIDYEFIIAGAKPARSLVDIPNRDHRITLIPNPSDMNSVIASSSLTVAPMQSGSGQQFKVLESLALSVPVVATSIASSPLELENNKHLIVADNPACFADSIILLLSNYSLRSRVTQAGWDHVSQHFSWAAKTIPLVSMYHKILKSSTP